MSHPTEAPEAARLRVRHAIYFAIAVCVSLVVVLTFGVWSSHQSELREKEIATVNLAQTLSRHAEATIKQADIMLFGLVERLEMDGMGIPQLKRLKSLLQKQRAELPQLHGLFVYDETGRWLVSSNETMPANANNSDREYFTFHRDHPGRGPHIGLPIQSRSTKEWIITVSRRINHNDGSFAGVALATIHLNYFLELYGSIDIGKNGIVNLSSADGMILMRHPFRASEIGTDISYGYMFSKVLTPAVSSGFATTRSVVDGIERVFGFRRTEAYPLVVFVARDKHEILSDWRRESLRAAIVVAILLIILGTFGYRLVGLMKHQIRVENDLRDAQNQLVSANRTLELLALEDSLTALANRRKFDSFIRLELNRAGQSSNWVGLLLIDVDYFKKYNDRYGHQPGDDCLRAVSALIKQNIGRPTDLAARYGGEEFVVVLPGADTAGAFLVAEKIRTAVEQANIEHLEASTGIVTISVGVSAVVPVSDDALNALIGAADKALYLAKARGRNMSVIYDQAAEATGIMPDA